MSVYFLKAFRVHPSEPTAVWQGEIEPATFRSHQQASEYAAWCIEEQGLRDTVIVPVDVECPVIDGVVFVPPSVL